MSNFRQREKPKSHSQGSRRIRIKPSSKLIKPSIDPSHRFQSSTASPIFISKSRGSGIVSCYMRLSSIDWAQKIWTRLFSMRSRLSYRLKSGKYWWNLCLRWDTYLWWPTRCIRHAYINTDTRFKKSRSHSVLFVKATTAINRRWSRSCQAILGESKKGLCPICNGNGLSRFEWLQCVWRVF